MSYTLEWFWLKVMGVSIERSEIPEAEFDYSGFRLYQLSSKQHRSFRRGRLPLDKAGIRCGV